MDMREFDWEKLAKMADAGEVRIRHLHKALYGWDCDSIVVLNPDVVVTA